MSISSSLLFFILMNTSPLVLLVFIRGCCVVGCKRDECREEEVGEKRELVKLVTQLCPGGVKAFLALYTSSSLIFSLSLPPFRAVQCCIILSHERLHSIFE
jgi:hypothetical protein